MKRFPSVSSHKKKTLAQPFFLRTCSSKQRIFRFLCGFSCVERWCIDRVIDLSTPGSHIHKSTSLHSTLHGWEAAQRPPKREKKIKGGEKTSNYTKTAIFCWEGPMCVELADFFLMKSRLLPNPNWCDSFFMKCAPTVSRLSSGSRATKKIGYLTCKTWMWPPSQDACDHQDYCMFSTKFQPWDLHV